MGLKVKNYKPDAKIRSDIQKVYDTAFPPDEKAPFDVVIRKAEQKKADMLVAYEDGEFIGFAYTVCNDKAAYLFYLAISEGRRGHGYGGKLIEAVKVRYSGRKIFLAREAVDESADNYQQRVSRRNFYIRCGFVDIPCTIREAFVYYDVMSIGGEMVTAEEYDELITNWGGWLRKKIFRMKLTEKRN